MWSSNQKWPNNGIKCGHPIRNGVTKDFSRLWYFDYVKMKLAQIYDLFICDTLYIYICNKEHNLFKLNSYEEFSDK